MVQISYCDYCGTVKESSFMIRDETLRREVYALPLWKAFLWLPFLSTVPILTFCNIAHQLAFKKRRKRLNG